MIADIPFITPVFQVLLNATGWVLSRVYDVIPNFGVAILVLTLVIRLLLLPLFIKQMKNMQAMQAIQPKIKEIQRKFKGDRQKIQAEQMKLYQDSGVNPLSSCLPMLLQFPILITIYAVIRPPQYLPVDAQSQQTEVVSQIEGYRVMNNHIPIGDALFADTVTHETSLFVNLQCSFVQAGSQAEVSDTKHNPVVSGKPLFTSTGVPIVGLTTHQPLDCGSKWPAKIPFGGLLLVMIAGTYYQQRQMQGMNPPGAAGQQQQMIMRLMPLTFAFLGIGLPAGVVLYWTLSTGIQVAQQHFLMLAGHIGPAAAERSLQQRQAKIAAKATGDDSGPRKNVFSRIIEKADQERKRRQEELIKRETTQRKPGSGKGGSTGSGGSKPGSGGSGSGGSGTSGSSGGRKSGGTGSTGSGGSKNGNRGSSSRRRKRKR